MAKKHSPDRGAARSTRTDRTLVLSVGIEDCTVQTFRSGGKGGQNQNKRDTGVRVIHPPSGARGESREERSQLQNKRAAFERMARSEKFTTWVRQQVGDPARDVAAVERELWPDRTLVEVRDADGNWVPASGGAHTGTTTGSGHGGGEVGRG